jgi:hypothetical protein
VAVQERQQLLPEEASEDTVEKRAVLPEHGEKIRQLLCVRQVAAALAADQDFLSRPVRLFQEQDRGAAFGRPARRHHTARPGADNDDPAVIRKDFLFLFPLHLTLPFMNSTYHSRRVRSTMPPVTYLLEIP